MIELKVVNITSIVYGERFRQDFGDLDMLIASVKKEGIIQPLAVKDNGNGTYTLLAGGRRYTAAEKAGIKEVPVRIYPETLSELEMRSIELMENVARKDLSWVEEANLNREIHRLQQQIYGKKMSTSEDATGVSLRDTANLLNISVGSLSESVTLADALDVFPELKQIKNKTDAIKHLKKLKTTATITELANQLKSQVASTPLDIIHHELISNFIVGDFFAHIKEVPDNSVDIVELDPPYGIDLVNVKSVADKTIVSNYNEVPAGRYIEFISAVLKECYRVMSENSWLICWFGPEPWFEPVYMAAMRAGFAGNRIASIWYKATQGQTANPSCYLANTWEPFFYFRKGRPSIVKQSRQNVFVYKPIFAQAKVHPTERPIELVQDILSTFSMPSSRVLVPFLGSGNTILAASNLGMSAFGFELSEEYKHNYIIKVKSGSPGVYKSYKESEDTNNEDCKS